MGSYQNSGDIVKIPQHTAIYKPDEPHIIHGSLYFDSMETLMEPKNGVIVERYDTPLGIMYQILIDERYWCVKAEDVHWLGV